MIVWLLLTPVWLFFIFIIWLFIEVFRPQKKPCDTSNRHNKMRLVWFGFTRPNMFDGEMGYDINTTKGKWKLRLDCMRNEDKFFGIPSCWWLEFDEAENMSIAKKLRK